MCTYGTERGLQFFISHVWLIACIPSFKCVGMEVSRVSFFRSPSASGRIEIFGLLPSFPFLPSSIFPWKPNICQISLTYHSFLLPFLLGCQPIPCKATAGHKRRGARAKKKFLIESRDFPNNWEEERHAPPPPMQAPSSFSRFFSNFITRGEYIVRIFSNRKKYLPNEFRSISSVGKWSENIDIRGARKKISGAFLLGGKMKKKPL